MKLKLFGREEREREENSETGCGNDKAQIYSGTSELWPRIAAPFLKARARPGDQQLQSVAARDF